MKAEDCVIMIKINFLPYLPYLSRKAQFSFLTNQITKFEIVFTKNISISVGLLTDHTNCPFSFLHRKCVVVIKSRIKVPLSSPPSNLPPHRKNRTSGNWACWKNCSTGSYQYKEIFTSSWTTNTRLESLPCLRWIWKRQESKAKEFFFRTLYQWSL